MANLTLAGLSLRDLEYVVAVARHRHFGRAAQQCGVSQPALSEQVRKLEALLGVTLFERNRRAIKPTERGEALLARAEAVVGAARSLLEAARATAEPLTGEVHLGVIATLGPYYIPSVLKAARGRFPQLQLRLREGQTRDLLDGLRLGELDMVLAAAPLPLPDDGLTVATLFFEPFRLACPADHRLAGGPPPRLDDLRGDDLLLLEDGHCLREHALALCGTRRFTQHTRFASSLEMLRHMIAAGEGYSLFPLLALAGHEEPLGGLMVQRPIADADAGRTIALVWRTSEPRQAEFAEVAAFLRGARPDATQVAS